MARPLSMATGLTAVDFATGVALEGAGASSASSCGALRREKREPLPCPPECLCHAWRWPREPDLACLVPERLPPEALGVSPLAALAFEGAAVAVSLTPIPQSGAKAIEKATKLLKIPRRKAAKFMKSFPKRAIGIWLDACAIVNKGTTGEMGPLHDREVEIACMGPNLPTRFRLKCGEFVAAG